MSDSRPSASSPRRVGVQEFRGNLMFFLKQVQEGQRFIIMSHDKVVAEISPPSVDMAIRRPGALRGKIRFPDDFDRLPADALKATEDGT